MTGQNLWLARRYFVRFSKENGSTDSDERSSSRARGAHKGYFCNLLSYAFKPFGSTTLAAKI